MLSSAASSKKRVTTLNSINSLKTPLPSDSKSDAGAVAGDALSSNALHYAGYASDTKQLMVRSPGLKNHRVNFCIAPLFFIESDILASARLVSSFA